MTLGAWCALGASLTWVIGSSAYTKLQEHYAAASINTTRAAIGLVFFLLLCLGRWQGVLNEIESSSAAFWLQQSAWLTASIASSYVFGDVLFLAAAKRLGYATSQGVAAIYPVWATLAGAVVRQESVGAARAGGVVLAIAGVILVLRATPEVSAPRTSSVGAHARSGAVLLALGASIFWALNSFATAQGGGHVHFALANVIRMLAALVLCPLSHFLRFREWPRLIWDAKHYVAFAPLVAVECCLGSSLYMYGLAHTPVAVGATLSSLAPVISVPVAVALGWEKFSWLKMLAVVCVVAAVRLLV